MSLRQRSALDAALPRISRYRFRLRDDAAQRAFALPPYLAQRRLCGFNLDQEPSERAAYDCGHQLMVDLYDNQQLVFRLSGIADWEHEDRPHNFAESVRETSERIFGTATSCTANLLNELDRFSIPARHRDLPRLIEQYVRELAPYLAVTRGNVSYLHVRP